MAAGYKREVKPGVWELQVSTGKKKNGRYVKKYKTVHGSEAMASKALAEFYAEVHGTTSEQMKISTLIELYDADIEHRIQIGELKKSAKKTMHAPLHQWVEPYLGDLRLDKLSADDIQDMVDEMTETISAKTVHNYLGVLSRLLDFARRNLKIYDKDPLQQVRLPRHRRPAVEYYTADEVEKILQAIDKMDDEDPYKSCFLILLFSGIRLGELAGLNKDDYDSETGTLHIVRSRQTVAGDGIIEDTPKTAAGVRTIKLPRAVCDVLDKLIAWQNKTIATRNDYEDTGALLLSGLPAIYQGRRAGSPLSPLAISRAWQRFCEKSDIKIKTLHKLRHTHASMVAELTSVAPTNLQSHMGHADLSVTQAIYSHAFTDAEEKIAEELQNRFFGGLDK